jgi:hypothetical protein
VAGKDRMQLNRHEKRYRVSICNAMGARKVSGFFIVITDPFCKTKFADAAEGKI